jgi:cobalt-precorrin 5A hydrolase/precorrin-3B C17-methyltransferase
VNVVSVSITGRGHALAQRLPYDHVHGGLGDAVRRRWSEVDAFVLFAATGVAVRVVGPLLASKQSDPAVVCVDDTGRYVVALCGGHGRGGNALAREVAAMLGATAVVTTASDNAGAVALDALAGLPAEGDLGHVMSALVDGRDVRLQNPLGWPLPADLSRLAAPDAGWTGPLVRVTDAATAPPQGTVLLRPPSLVVGVGASSHARPSELRALVDGALVDAGLARRSVASVATIDRRSDDDAVQGLGWPVRALTAEVLSTVAVPTPSDTVAAAVGTPSVAEAAALAAAGPGGELVVTKRKSATATVAVARRSRPRGRLAVVGLGPGTPHHRTLAATTAVRHAELVVGYGPYVDQCTDALAPGASVVRLDIGQEQERVRVALAAAAAGRRVALVCSGDAGIYALASLVFERAGDWAALDPNEDIEVIPGVTAAVAAAALLGAPLGHDHAVVSLSDLLTPWDVIEDRLEHSAAADLVLALYNPRSGMRTWQLPRALEMVARHRPPATPVGIVTDAGRPSQRVSITRLDEVDVKAVGMTTCVIIGSSTTRVVDGRLVTPRGYKC